MSVTEPPLPPGMGPAPVYRQDESVLRATSWTRPMQLSVAAYLVLGPILSLVLQLVMRDQYKALLATQFTKQLQAAGRPADQATIDSNVSLGLTFALVFAVVFAIVFFVLAALTAGKPRTWVFWVDLVLLGLGAIGLVAAIVGLANPSGASAPQAVNLVSLVTGLVQVALAAWMIFGLVKFGPWAQEKAPATL